MIILQLKKTVNHTIYDFHYHSIQAKCKQHEEEDDGPEWWQGQPSQSLWIDHKSNPWTYTKKRAYLQTRQIKWLLGQMKVKTMTMWWVLYILKKKITASRHLIIVNHSSHTHMHSYYLPSSATLSIGTLSSWAMKPITEKMTKPAKILVALLVHATMRVSLQNKETEHIV